MRNFKGLHVWAVGDDVTSFDWYETSKEKSACVYGTMFKFNLKGSSLSLLHIGPTIQHHTPCQRPRRCILVSFNSLFINLQNKIGEHFLNKDAYFLFRFGQHPKSWNWWGQRRRLRLDLTSGFVSATIEKTSGEILQEADAAGTTRKR